MQAWGRGLPEMMPVVGGQPGGMGAGVSGRNASATQNLPWTTGRRLKPSMAISGVLPWCYARGERRKRSVLVRAAIQEQEQEREKKEGEQPKVDVDETTRKRGLEAGLWQIFTSKDTSEEGSKRSKTSQAKDLLTRYGGAYLATSISLSLVSFGLCYVLINNGIDVTSLLEKVGIHASETGEKVGTFALAYAAHKAASPIRFPPTVALTPIVAGWFGKKSADILEDQNKD